MYIQDIPQISDIMEVEIHNKINIKNIDELEYKILKNFVEGALFIVDENNKLMGVVTDGDIRKNFSIYRQNNLKDIVTWNPKKIFLNENASVALRILRENEINILPIVDENNVLKGYVSLHMLLNSFSPERLYISKIDTICNDNEQRHLARYNFALNFIKKGSYCLDCACGSGYGSKILSIRCSEVLGIDLSEDAICFAKIDNSSKNIKYIQHDLAKLSFAKNTFDAIISIETLEHVANSTFLSFLENINKWLKNGGIFIGSSPMLRYKNGKPYITNPYHINEMPKADFMEAIRSKLSNFQIHFYYQDQDVFLPLGSEHTGFCVVVARKNL